MKLPVNLDNFAHGRELRRWQGMAEQVDELDIVSLAAMRQQASDLRRAIDRATAEADRRVSTPGARKVVGPRDSDWAWRPPVFRTRMAVPGHAAVASGTPLGEEAKLFHDCTVSEICIAQRPGMGRAGTAPLVLALDVLDFGGSFLSIVVDLPPRATEGLTLSHIVQADMTIEAERPIEMFARLNVKHGPNVEQIVRELDLSEATVPVEFDLAYSDIVESSVERAWIDVIFGQPSMNRVVIGDMIVSRRLRAEM